MKELSFPFSSPLNVSLDKYMEVNQILPYIYLDKFVGKYKIFMDCNIENGLLMNYFINNNLAERILIYGFNKYVNSFWKYYFADSKLLFRTINNFYQKHSVKDEYYPFYLMQKIPLEKEFDYAVHYGLYSGYLNTPNYRFTIKNLKPEHPFVLNKDMFWFSKFPKDTYVYPEFDKFKPITDYDAAFVYSNLGGMGLNRYFKFFSKIWKNYKICLTTQEFSDILPNRWNRVKMNNFFLYRNYETTNL